uniref:palmitoyl-CoA hydrolase n=1 Tax=Xenopsylla cheopis TaxID=163159 RepID=A0A6M2DEZ8_XENCH
MHSLLIFFFGLCNAYKPVVLMHGILTGSNSMNLIENRIREIHPGTIIYNTGKFAGWSSLEPAWRQVNKIIDELQQISENHPDGIHVIGYSQGGLLSRAAVQSFSDHNVKKLISLSSPQAGQYGAAFLHLIFPNLVCKTAYELFYSRVGQYTSVGNYWNDPYHQDLYMNISVFLPYVNNELESSKSQQFKNSLKKLEKFILIGGPDDGVITPWESSQFGYFDIDGNVIPLQERDIYTKDLLGLRNMAKNNKLIFVTFYTVLLLVLFIKHLCLKQLNLNSTENGFDHKLHQESKEF